MAAKEKYYYKRVDNLSNELPGGGSADPMWPRDEVITTDNKSHTKARQAPRKKKNKAKPQTTSHVKRLNGFRHNRAENYYFFLSNREIKLCFELNSIDPERKWLGNPNEA